MPENIINGTQPPRFSQDHLVDPAPAKSGWKHRGVNSTSSSGAVSVKKDTFTKRDARDVKPLQLEGRASEIHPRNSLKSKISAQKLAEVPCQLTDSTLIQKGDLKTGIEDEGYASAMHSGNQSKPTVPQRQLESCPVNDLVLMQNAELRAGLKGEDYGSATHSGDQSKPKVSEEALAEESYLLTDRVLNQKCERLAGIDGYTSQLKSNKAFYFRLCSYGYLLHYLMPSREKRSQSSAEYQYIKQFLEEMKKTVGVYPLVPLPVFAGNVEIDGAMDHGRRKHSEPEVINIYMLRELSLLRVGGDLEKKIERLFDEAAQDALTVSLRELEEQLKKQYASFRSPPRINHV